MSHASPGDMDEFDEVARTEVQPGWDIVDADGDLIGVVDEVREGSFTVRLPGPLSPMVDVSFTDIESADDGRVDLAVSAAELGRRTDPAG